MSLLGLREMHRFEGGGKSFAYLVPSAAIFQLDETSEAILDTLENRYLTERQLAQSLADRFPEREVVAGIDELTQIRAVGDASEPEEQIERLLPQEDFPLTTMVLNVTNKCNLACTYCYEYGDDKIVDTDCGDKPSLMSEETARQSVDFMLKQSGSNKVAHLTFFGGETLLNFNVLKKTLAYAKERGAEVGKQVEFSLTTNGTLLKPAIIEWLAENRVGVTVSIDGPKEMQDEFRVFHNGRGSYDIMMPKVKELLRRHRTRPIGARVTLTKQNLDVKRIFRHLTEEVGFWEVGFAPVTTSWQRDYAIENEGFEKMLGQFQGLAEEFLEYTLDNRHHGFSNIKDTIEEIHKGVSKAFPCGAGLGLMGVATDGDVALCHRFAGSDEHKIGSVFDGVDTERQFEFLQRHHIASKTDCHTCWARPLCAGGCYHEAHTRYGDTGAPNLHYCEWIRRWTDTCLRVYGELAERNPGYLAQFDEAA